MKKTLALVVLAIMVMATSARAEGVWDSVIGYITAQETETGIYYNFDDKATHGYIGRTLAQDVFIKRADLSLIWDIKDAIGVEASYVIKEGTVSPYVGGIVGTNRIENIADKELGEVFFAVSGGVKF